MLTHFALLISESSFWISMAYISGLTPANFVIFQPIFFLLVMVKIITWYVISFLKQSFHLLSIYKNHWFTLFLLIHNDTDCIHEQNFNIFFFPTLESCSHRQTHNNSLLWSRIYWPVCIWSVHVYFVFCSFNILEIIRNILNAFRPQWGSKLISFFVVRYWSLSYRGFYKVSLSVCLSICQFGIFLSNGSLVFSDFLHNRR